MMMPCPKCGSDKIIPNVRIVSREFDQLDSGDVSLEVYRQPEALLFKGTLRDPLRAQVCGQCGLTELYANDPGALWETHQAAGGS